MMSATNELVALDTQLIHPFNQWRNRRMLLSVRVSNEDSQFIQNFIGTEVAELRL